MFPFQASSCLRLTSPAPPTQAAEGPGIGTRLWHNAKYGAFRAYRGLDYTGLVLVHFFGLNNHRYQWMLDIADREKRQEEQWQLEESQRRTLREQEVVRQAQAAAGELEGGSGT